MDIEDSRKGIYFLKGYDSFPDGFTPLSHTTVVLPLIVESQRNKICGERSISFHNSVVQRFHSCSPKIVTWYFVSNNPKFLLEKQDLSLKIE